MDSHSNMRKVTLHRSLWKPILVMGCERPPFIIIMMSSLLLVVQGSFQVKIIGIIFFVVMVAIMAFLTSKDPYFFKILFRYLHYQDYYPSSAMWPGKIDCPKNTD